MANELQFTLYRREYAQMCCLFYESKYVPEDEDDNIYSWSLCQRLLDAACLPSIFFVFCLPYILCKWVIITIMIWRESRLCEPALWHINERGLSRGDTANMLVPWDAILSHCTTRYAILLELDDCAPIACYTKAGPHNHPFPFLYLSCRAMTTEVKQLIGYHLPDKRFDHAANNQ